MKPNEIVEAARAIPTWLSDPEKLKLAALAQEVPAGGTIVEVGSLYGGSTALLALGQPAATVYAHDEFSWSPITERPASAEEMTRNLKALGIENVRIVEGDSRITGKAWKGPIDLLWIDGGHNYEYVRADLENFGPSAHRIVLHDWQNPGWPSVTKAIQDFLKDHPEFFRGVVVDMLVELWRPGADGAEGGGNGH